MVLLLEKADDQNDKDDECLLESQKAGDLIAVVKYYGPALCCLASNLASGMNRQGERERSISKSTFSKISI